jgi:hypothetical protein
MMQAPGLPRSGRKAMPAKAFVAPEIVGAALLKKAPAKAPPGTQVSKGTSVPPKASVSKAATTVVGR